MARWCPSWKRTVVVGLLVLFWGSGASAQVDPKKPYEGITRVLPIPPLPGATGWLPDAPLNQNSPHDLHGGAFTWGLDLVTAGKVCPDPWGSCTTTWVASLAPPPTGPLAFTASPAFTPRLVDEALGSATARLAALDPGAIGDAFALFDLLPGAPIKEPTKRKDWFFGYRPVRARWLASRYVPTGQVFWLVEKKVTYADYAPFDDVRLQGARLYCAARRLQFAQGGNARSLGERAGFSIDVLGHTLDFLVVEPTVAIDGPMKFLTPLVAGVPPDGAQAFIVPFTFGARVTPIRGLGLPDLGEARVPVVLVTGDTEVKNATDRRLIFEIGKGGLSSTLAFSKEYHTVTHADAIVSAGFYDNQKYSVDKTFPFLIIGPLTVSATFELKYDVGRPSSQNDRILQVAPWPNTPRTGHLYANPDGFIRYHDGAWLLGKKRAEPFLRWQVQPDGQTDPFWTDPIVQLSATDLRALANDDHTFSSATGLELSLGLQGTLGLNAGPFKITMKVHGSFTGSVEQEHVLRDALMAEGPPPGFLAQMVPGSVVTVRPQQKAAVTFDGLKAGLEFRLDLLFGSIDFEKTFFNLGGFPVADYDSSTSWDPADERYTLRIGTGSSFGSPMTKPAIYSHLPGGTDILSFPEDVAACLADPKPVPPLKEPCPPTKDNGSPPHMNVCIYGPSLSLVEKLGSAKGLTLPELPPNACASLGSWPPSVGGFPLTPDVKACFTNLVQVLCEPQAVQLNWQSREVVSHVWNFDAEYGYALQGVMKQCVMALQSPGSPVEPEFIEEDVKDILKEFVSVGPCDDLGYLYKEDAILKAVNPKQAPTPKPGLTCSVQ